MNVNDTPEAPEADSAPSPTAGAILAQAREAAGLTIDDVALQLKLAPRQVVAIERDDFANLPGRTFIRGFTRNYARLLKLDVDAVLDALPGEHAAAPGGPPLAAATRAIGEMPRERTPRPGVARWAIPLVLLAIVAVAAFYEFARPPAARAPSAPSPLPATPPAAPATSTIPLDNPVRPISEPTTSAPPVTAPATAPATESAATTPATVVSAQPAVVAAPPESSPRVGNQLALRFRGTSWVEVRDRSGGVVLSMTGSEGATREIQVATPGEVIVGNAGAVDATWRGRPIDMTALARQNVARIKLD